MTINIRRLLAIGGMWLLAASIQAQTLDTVSAQGRPLVQDFPQSSLIIDTSADTCEHFGIFIASERNAQARGLMFVREMPDDVGMLFIHPGERMISMWMKNTLIPLDMFFADDEGRIVTIAARTTPLSEKRIPSGEPVRYVLEMIGGSAERLGIVVGDRLRHALIGRP